MGSFRITTTPQQIFPFGQQDSMVIQNNGPYAVYIDSDSSIDGNSHKIPPTGVMAWDNERPLWVVADSVAGPDSISTISVVRNSSPVDYSNDTDSTLTIFPQLAADTGFPAYGNSCISGVLDVSAYKTLSLQIYTNGSNWSYSAQDAINLTKSWVVGVKWYDSNMNLLSGTTLSAPFNAKGLAVGASDGMVSNFQGVQGTRILIPVRGTFVNIKIQTPQVLSTNDFNATLLGLTRILPTRVSFSPFEPMAYQGGNGNSIIYSTLSDDGFSLSTGDQNLVSDFYRNMTIPGLSKQIRVTLRWATPITVAGLFDVRSAWAGSVPYGPSLPIPVAAAGGSLSATYDVPELTPVNLTFPNIPQSAGPVPTNPMHMSVTYL
jgi:hypothetical protein